MSHSILENFIPNGSVLPARSARSREDRNKDIAIHHAQLLQQRKDVEALILASTEAMLDLPSSPAADPARPRLQDVALVKNFLRPFQPSDYDSLIEERNIDKKCGYVLCPRLNRQEGTKARYRLLHGNGRDKLKFVEQHILERWCSDDCGKRALYLKVQLSEEPAWTRVGSSGGDLLFLEDERNGQKRHEDDSTLTEKLESLNMGLDEDEVITRMKALIIERGDGKAPSRAFALAEIDVREKRNANRKASASKPLIKQNFSAGGFESIEGYTPKLPRKEPHSGSDDDEDLISTI